MKCCQINILLSLVLLMLTACQKADDGEQQEAVAAIRMIAAGKPFPDNATTRVAGATEDQLQNTLLLPAEKIGVYIDNASDPTSNEYNMGLPIAHTVLQTGYVLQPDGYEAGTYPEYPNQGLGAINVYAFYPYSLVSGVQRLGTELPVSVQTDQTAAADYRASDFMAADPVYGHYHSGNDEDLILLSFNHLMTKVTVKLRKIGGFQGDLTGFTLYFRNSLTAGTLDLEAQTVTADGTASPHDITMMTVDTDLEPDEERASSIITVPQVMGSGTFLVLTDGNVTYSASLPLADATWTYVDTTTWTDPNGSTGLTLEAGYEYVMTATVTDTSLQIDAIIKDFQVGGEYNGKFEKAN